MEEIRSFPLLFKSLWSDEFMAVLVMGLAIFFFIRPWLKPIRRSFEAGHEVNIEKSRLEAAKVRESTAQTEDRANRAAITAERSRQERIQAQAANDEREEARRRAAARKEDADEQIEEIEEAVRVEEARARLRWTRLQNDQQMPPPWKIKRQYIKWAVILAVLFILTTIVSIYFSK